MMQLSTNNNTQLRRLRNVYCVASHWIIIIIIILIIVSSSSSSSSDNPLPLSLSVSQIGLEKKRAVSAK